ncbi:cyclase family protein [Nisaea sp.]|uniref:cyclase family protein n=1 Tax=Nisaea sp. TaxID=2024842 RepID=UPI002B269718|nr:cyclase family protein [Nisaea sp.]
MKKYVVAVMAIAGALGFGGAANAECTPENWKGCAGKPWVDGDKMETPLGSKWWPNPLWGAGDEAGSTNWYLKPEVVMRALSQIKTGKTYKLGHPYTADMPLFGARKFSLRIPGAPTGGAFGGNQVLWNDEFLATEIGQVGTQFDGLGHIGVNSGTGGNKGEMRWYNGFTADEMITPYGLKKLGTEKLHPIVARGILLDIAAARGVDAMAAGEVITMADVQAALKKQGMEGFQFTEGDAIIFRTGWEKYWDDAATYNNGCPGIGMEVARWVAEDVKAGVTGADTWPVDAVPNPDPACVFCVHTFLQTRHGIVNQENMKLSELAADGVYQFAYIYTPTPVAGATGSMGAPLAIR